MKTITIIQTEIHDWARANFGYTQTPYLRLYEKDQNAFWQPVDLSQKMSLAQVHRLGMCVKDGLILPGLNELAPLLGIGEEIGELFEARAIGAKDSMEDAVGDILIYTCDLSARSGVALNNQLLYGAKQRLPYGCEEGMVVYYGKLNHAYLKRYQSIRSMQDDVAFTDAKTKAIAFLLYYLHNFVKEHLSHTTLLQILNEVWQKQVQKRDWRKFPNTGVQHEPTGQENGGAEAVAPAEPTTAVGGGAAPAQD